MRIECSVCCFAMFYSRITISFILLTFFIAWLELQFENLSIVSLAIPMIRWFKSLNFELDSGYKTEENTIKLWFSKPVQQCERFLFKSEIKVKKKSNKTKSTIISSDLKLHTHTSWNSWKTDESHLVSAYRTKFWTKMNRQHSVIIDALARISDCHSIWLLLKTCVWIFVFKSDFPWLQYCV